MALSFNPALPLTPDPPVTCFWEWITWKDYKVKKIAIWRVFVPKKIALFSHPPRSYPPYAHASGPRPPSRWSRPRFAIFPSGPPWQGRGQRRRSTSPSPAARRRRVPPPSMDQQVEARMAGRPRRRRWRAGEGRSGAPRRPPLGGGEEAGRRPPRSPSAPLIWRRRHKLPATERTAEEGWVARSFVVVPCGCSELGRERWSSRKGGAGTAPPPQSHTPKPTLSHLVSRRCRQSSRAELLHRDEVAGMLAIRTPETTGRPCFLFPGSIPGHRAGGARAAPPLLSPHLLSLRRAGNWPSLPSLPCIRGATLLRLLPPRHPCPSSIRPRDGCGREGEELASSRQRRQPCRLRLPSPDPLLLPPGTACPAPLAPPPPPSPSSPQRRGEGRGGPGVAPSLHRASVRPSPRSLPGGSPAGIGGGVDGGCSGERRDDGRQGVRAQH
jgi:hypothetical protein